MSSWELGSCRYLAPPKSPLQRWNLQPLTIVNCQGSAGSIVAHRARYRGCVNRPVQARVGGTHPGFGLVTAREVLPGRCALHRPPGSGQVTVVHSAFVKRGPAACLGPVIEQHGRQLPLHLRSNPTSPWSRGTGDASRGIALHGA